MSDEHDDAPGGDGGTISRVAVQPAARTRRPPSRRRYRLRRALALLVLVVVGFAAWFAIELFEPFAGAGSGRSVAFAVAHDQSDRQIGDLLARDGVVSNGFFFELRAKLDGAKFYAGTYQLRQGMSYGAALTALEKPPAPAATVRITIPEGYTRREIASRAASDGLRGSYLVASRPSSAFSARTYGASSHVHTLEGFLFPATYDEFPHADVAKLVAQQLDAFQQNFNQLPFTRSGAAGLTRYDVLIIASMVEREAQVPADRALVAAVIYNRLKAGMTLGIDAALRYALNDYTHPLTASQLALDTPYNTRLHHGLPPTPISNPGLASMVAAAEPARVSYLYYVTKPGTCGKLAFSTSYADFLRDQQAYNDARNAAGGRSPTTCP